VETLCSFHKSSIRADSWIRAEKLR
jgi:hypothetical protein